MKRRDFIMLLGGGAVATWPLAALAQQLRPRIAVLSLNTARDEGKVLAAFLDGMRALATLTDKTSTSTIAMPAATPRIWQRWRES